MNKKQTPLSQRYRLLQEVNQNGPGLASVEFIEYNLLEYPKLVLDKNTSIAHGEAILELGAAYRRVLHLLYLELCQEYKVMSPKAYAFKYDIPPNILRAHKSGIAQPYDGWKYSITFELFYR